MLFGFKMIISPLLRWEKLEIRESVHAFPREMISICGFTAAVTKLLDITTQSTDSQ